jgi:hypothetical protein
VYFYLISQYIVGTFLGILGPGQELTCIFLFLALEVTEDVDPDEGTDADVDHPKLWRNVGKVKGLGW